MGQAGGKLLAKKYKSEQEVIQMEEEHIDKVDESSLTKEAEDMLRFNELTRAWHPTGDPVKGWPRELVTCYLQHDLIDETAGLFVLHFLPI